MAQNFPEQTFNVTGPDFSCTLTAWEQQVRVYSKRVLCFSNEAVDTAMLTKILKNALQSTVSQIPMLAGEVVQLPSEQSKQENQQGLRPAVAKLKVKDLTSVMDCEELRRKNFPQSMLKSEWIAPIARSGSTAEPAPVCVIGACFIKGGLLLVFSIHHGVLDGTGITTFIKLFAENCRGEQHALTTGFPYSPALLDKVLFDRSRLIQEIRDPTCPDNHPFMPISKSRFKLGEVPDFLDSANFPFSCQAFHLSAQSQKRLEAETLAQMAKLNINSFISNHDAITALLFRSVTGARYTAGLLKEDDQVQLWFPIDMRRKLQPPLPPNALFNAHYTLSAVLSVKDVLDPQGLGKAALAIRAAIESATMERLLDALALLQSVPKVGDLTVKFAQDIRRTCIFYTSYYKFDIYGLKWPSAFGTFERFRLPSDGVINGMNAVYPAEPDGSCDIALTQDVEVLRQVRRLDEWSRYTEPIEKEVLQ